MSFIVSGHDPWTICDSCGFQVRRSQTRKTWDNRIVCAATCWDEKFPKTGTVPFSGVKPNKEVRPQKSSEAGTTTLSSSAGIYAKSVTVTSATGIVYGSSIGIVLDDGTTHWDIVSAAPSGTTITIEEGLDGAAASGNTVYVPRLSEESFVTGKTGVEDIT